jgi:hypothetical protein
MAILEVTGEVIRHLGSKGFTLAEPRREMVNGQWQTAEGKKYFSIWAEQLPAVGSQVTVKGSLSVKLDEYEGKQSIKVNVNAFSVVPALDHQTVAKAQQDFAKIVQDSAPSVDDLPF